MPSAIKTLLRNVALGVIPYPDWRKRAKVRRAARKLVRCDPWPGNDAAPLQLAELCLQHSLWLQRSAHRAVFGRQTEAAAMLARASVETCILGLYCLVSDEALEEMSGANARTLGHLVQYMVDLNILPKKVVEIGQRYVGDTEAKRVNTFEMAKAMKDITGHSLTMDLYRRQYVPLSTLFSHANGLVLLRHVGKNGKILNKPSFPWVRQSAIHAADVSVGVLALAVSEKSDLPTKMFADYANAHIKRSLAPVFVMALRSVGGSIKWRQLRTSYEGYKFGKEFAESREYKTMSPEERQPRWHEILNMIFSGVDPVDDPGVRQELLEAFAEMIAASEYEEEDRGPDSVD